MLYYEFAPLKEDYKIITVSPSELESVLAPSLYQMDDVRKRALTLEIGHMLEAIAWAIVSNDSNDLAIHLMEITRSYLDKERMNFYSPKGDLDKQFLWVYEGLEQMIPLYTPYKGTYDLRNRSAIVEIDFSGYKILLEGEVDWGISGYHLYDNKTAKTKWKDDKWITGCFQGRIYSWMNMLATGAEKLDFTYLVCTKQKKMQLQDITHTVSRKECEDFVYDKLYNYCLGLHNGAIEDKSTALDRI